MRLVGVARFGDDAIHEAAHAVVAHACGGRVHSLSLTQAEVSYPAGSVGLLVAHLAGPVAETGGLDWSHAEALMLRHGLDWKTTLVVERESKRIVDDLFAEIERVARVLRRCGVLDREEFLSWVHDVFPVDWAKPWEDA